MCMHCLPSLLAVSYCILSTRQGEVEVDEVERFTSTILSKPNGADVLLDEDVTIIHAGKSSFLVQ